MNYMNPVRPIHSIFRRLPVFTVSVNLFQPPALSDVRLDYVFRVDRVI